MHLELDIGNTRTHWRMASSGQQGDFNSSLWQGQTPLPAALTQLQPAHIRLCSVQSAQLNWHIQQRLQQCWALKPQWAQVTTQAGGVTNGYRLPHSLGVDRWLALLAAWQQAQAPCLVLDAGTALTLDLLGAQGQHLGGYIFPGCSSLLQSFHRHTQGVRPESALVQSHLGPGQDTTGCVQAAQNAAFMGLLQAAYSQLPQAQALFLCGGDASRLEPLCAQLPLRLHKVPQLVLDGLSLCVLTSLEPP